MHLVFANKIRYGTAYWLVIETINQYNVAALSPISAGALFICTSNHTVSVAYKINILPSIYTLNKNLSQNNLFTIS